MLTLPTLTPGDTAPLGSTVTSSGVNFAIFSAHATSVTLCLFSEDGKTETAQLKLPSRTGDIWHGFAPGLKHDQLYGYRVDGPYAPHDGHRFNRNKLLIDPYAKRLFGDFVQHDALYGFDVNAPNKDLSFSRLDSAPYMPKCVVGDPIFDWEDSTPPATSWQDTVVYEAHVKGLTQRHPGVKPTHRGTLSGLSSPAMISHLKKLGVTAIELLPVQSFFSEPRLTEMGLTNYWGYNPVNYFAAHAPYLGPNGEAAFQDAVKALHEAGIEIILDVVYNHTAESWRLGPTLSYRGIDNASYYHLQDDQRFYVNHTGCGNALDMSHPRVLELTLASLRYWAEHMHVDGFRFDLAPTLGRNPNDFSADAPFFMAIKADPALSKLKLIAEPWDIGPDGYVLGGFPTGWTEWNDQYRDDVRAFWRKDHYAHKSLAARLLGSADQFDHSGRNALSSLNFITSHDGFTLEDIVSFNDKHNAANGEQNRDGHGHNLSDNMGHEGPTDDPDITAKRRQRKKNVLTTLFLSQGTPMLLAGDEFGQSQNGNNNAYCQDNEITWLDWAGMDTELADFTTKLISLRKIYPHFKQTSFLHGEALSESIVPNVQWISSSGAALQSHEWDNPTLTCFGLALSMEGQDTIMIAFNRGGRCSFTGLGDWDCLLSTAKNVDKLNALSANSVSVFKYTGPYLTQDRKDEAVLRLSHDYGIHEAYRDITGHVHHASLETKRKLLAAMGANVSDAQGIDRALKETPPITAAPHDHPQVYGANSLRAHGKAWGVTTALYGLKSERNWGIGDFEDLAELAEIMAAKGADFIGINPVHALFPSAPDLYSPYSPSSRDFLNIMHIAPDKIPELAVDYPVDLERLQKPKHVDYTAVYSAKMKAFETAFERFEALPKDAPRRAAFQAYTIQKGESLHQHTLFDVLFERLPKAKRNYDGWINFHKDYEDPASKSSRDFAKTHANRLSFYTYLQWIAAQQLKRAQTRAKAAGMHIGLYLDFAVGVVPGGSDAWREKDAFANGISLGAPGDMANPDGQLWNLLPFNPHSLTQNNFEPYCRGLREAMSFGGALRIDHILGHLRSFWIPPGDTGGYVRYPFDGLLAMIAEESMRTKCIVFGEDLGTVPDDFRTRMADYGLMGCNIQLIERSASGEVIAREHGREMSMTAFSNHDFPTLAGFWEGEDFRWREELGIGNDPEVLRAARHQRRIDKSAFLHLAGLDHYHADKMTPRLMGQLQAYLAGGNALAFAVQLDDLLLETHQANVPGTTVEAPNWRRRTRLTLKEIASDPNVNMITRAIHATRAHNPR